MHKSLGVQGGHQILDILGALVVTREVATDFVDVRAEPPPDTRFDPRKAGVREIGNPNEHDHSTHHRRKDDQ